MWDRLCQLWRAPVQALHARAQAKGDGLQKRVEATAAGAVQRAAAVPGRLLAHPAAALRRPDGGEAPAEGATVVLECPVPPARVLAGWVVVWRGPQRGRDHRIWRGRNVVGTGADCDVVLSGPDVLPRHAVIEVDDAGVFLVGLGAGRTRVAGRAARRELLVDNDIIEIGDVELLLKVLP